jgi:DNA-binding transcriptional regulator YiaG
MTSQDIKNFMKAYRLRPSELAELLKVSRSTVSSWTSGKREITQRTVMQLELLKQSGALELPHSVNSTPSRSVKI